jgi:filamentous hemagglutinin family protein
LHPFFRTRRRGTRGGVFCKFRLAAALGVGFSLAASLTATAGDILRGGNTFTQPQGRASSGRGAASVGPARANARDALARTTRAVQAVQAMQAVARAVAIKGANHLGSVPNHPAVRLPDVPNGLAVGGLQVAPGVPSNPALWQGAALPAQTAANGRTNVTIKQTSQQAILTWKTFNVGKDTSLKFDQSAGGKDKGKWIAFNKINDPTGMPSQILGSMDAAGQIYVINQNGIIFGGSSQVNAHALVASSLPINDNLVSRGLLNNPDFQFLFSQLEVPVLPTPNSTMPAFTPPAAPNTPDGRNGDVVVQKGARISAPTTPEHVGGRVALIGPNVRNEGTISTPDGQTILAAGLQAGFTSHPGDDPSLRGLDVFVGAAPYGGTATNSGLIDAPRANVTLAGKSIKQLGVIDSSTSVSLNGRVDLRAEYNATVPIVDNKAAGFNPTTTGEVTLGAGSVTQILPERSSKESVVGTQLALQSAINMQGRAIHLANASQVLAPGASVTLKAGNWLPNGSEYFFTYDTGQVYLDRGAMINVAGSVDVSVPVSQNIVSIELRGSELADSPLQRSGPLRGVTLSVDLRQSGVWNGVPWIGTPLGNASGYAGLIQRTVGELTTAGGTVKVSAGSSVVMQPGSTIDVSGGWVSYTDGLVQTTRVISDGRLYDLAQATPDRVYDGIYGGTFTRSHSKWGITSTYMNPLLLSGARFEQGYVQGASGGSVAITAPAMALDGTLLGNSVTGPRQRASVPQPGAVSLVFQAQDASTVTFAPISPTPPNIVFQRNPSPIPADAFALDDFGDVLPLRADRRATVVLSPGLLTSSGFGSVKIDNGDGDITVPADVVLSAQGGGSITMVGANINIAGKVSAPGGRLGFTVFDYSPYGYLGLSGIPDAQTPQPDASRGQFTLGPTASLSTAGFIVNDGAGSPTAGTLPLLLNGGPIAITTYSARFAPGSAIDVSGGVALSASGRRTFGRAGGITIKAGQDANIGSLLGGRLELGGALKGFAGGKGGGSLSIQAAQIQIGGTDAGDNTLLLSPDFFNRGGFSSFTLAGLGIQRTEAGQYLPGVVIAPGTVIAPVAQSFVAASHAGGVDGAQLIPALQPPGIRPPVNLTFSALGVKDAFSNILLVRGDVAMGAGAVIFTGPQGSVTLSGDTVDVLGSIVAPGGAVAISGAKAFPELNPPTQPLPTVHIGPQSLISTAGTTVLTPDPRGFRTGTVLPGGTISVSGNIVAEAGARLDVSGASGLLDLSPACSGRQAGSRSAGLDLNASLTGAPLVPTRVESNGGTIILKGGQELFTDATLTGDAGGPTAQGGSLLISSGRFYPDPNSQRTPLDVTLIVTQREAAIPVPFYPAGQTAIGHPVLDQNGIAADGLGHFAVDRFNRRGFDTLSLGGTVRFSGPVQVNAPRSLLIGDGGVVYADASVTLNAPYVALGMAFRGPIHPQQQDFPFTAGGLPFPVMPTHGEGSLATNARLIDIGNLSLQGIGSARFVANGGDIRGDGTLDVAGSIDLRAGQIYPPTAVKFTIAAWNYQTAETTQPGSVSIVAGGSRPLPLSAGGTLSVHATIIDQGGLLRAPLGTIVLGWDGVGTGPKDGLSGATFDVTQQLTLGPASITSVSAVDPGTGRALILPYGVNLNGTSWIDPSGADITAGGPPQKSVNVSAVNVAELRGSLVDIRGGGDLYAYRWVPGVGGSRDVVASSSSFAIVPTYTAGFAPHGAFNTSPLATSLNGDRGYVNGGLSVGDRIHLDASTALPAGTYTLLPARYALLPGAFLVTPQSGTPIGTQLLSDGASIVSGYRLNGFHAPGGGQPIFARFEVAPSETYRARSEYADYFANHFIRQVAAARNTAVPRLPIDSGQLVLQATQTMVIDGRVASQAPSSGRGGLVDISSPADILIAKSGVNGGAGTLVLNSAELSAFGAESLLIGGIRTTGAQGVEVTVKTNNLTVDNAGTPLTGADVILAARNSLTLAPGAEINQTGKLSSAAEPLLLGSSSAAGSGDGALLRVSNDPDAQIARSGVSLSTAPGMVVGAGARLSGASLILDSSFATGLDPTATLDGEAITLNSGQISLQLANSGALQPTAGLVLAGPALQNLQSASRLSLLSYSSIDIYGAGQIGASTVASVALHAAEIRGFNASGGTVAFEARNIDLDNSPAARAPAPLPGTLDGTLAFQAETIRLGNGSLQISRYANLDLTASAGILARGAGSLGTEGALAMKTPLVTGAAGARQTISAGGALALQSSGGEPSATVTGGLGASMSFIGASVTAGGSIVLPSGALAIHATSGDVSLVGRIDVGGTAKRFFDLVKYTDGGSVRLTADAGSVNLAVGGTINVAADPDGGNAGSLSVGAPSGIVTLSGALRAQGAAGGRDGGFSLDAGTLPALSAINAALESAWFKESRSFRIRNGDVLVDGTAKAHKFNLSADGGSVTVSGTIDASGVEGGTIDLAASGSVTLSPGALLTVAAQDFGHAGKGGAISLGAGIETNGVFSTSAFVDIRNGATINLAVASNTAASADAGHFTGTLHLRAPQTHDGTDLQVRTITGSVIGASSIVAEGCRLFDLTNDGGAITAAIRTSVHDNGAIFGGQAVAVANRLLVNNSGLDPVLSLVPGAEIINRSGDLTLGSMASSAADDWNLAAFRFGPRNVPGVLTLRAAGNLVFYNALSDGFTSSAYDAPLLAQNPLLPVNAQSWSYRLAAGADFTAADFRRVRPLASLPVDSGSLLLGKDAGSNSASSSGAGAQTSTAVAGRFQVIRTGTGDIEIAAGRDVRFLNQFATVYTAGAQVADPTLGGAFDVPQPKMLGLVPGGLGAIQQRTAYPVQYTSAGGNVSIDAQSDIVHLTRNTAGELVPDSGRELPTNWLYRRGYVDPATGQFGISKYGETASTTWWVDFSNFFQGVGTLGGGDVTLVAGRDISNVDAVAATNARMPGGTPDSSKLLELGGGDVLVRAGRDIDGGIYYVERGRGTLGAGNSIHTNSTRSPSLTSFSTPGDIYPAETWLPTTLFLGKGGFDVGANGDLLLGPVANPFLLPAGYNNTYWYKSYFSTYAASNFVNAASLTGTLTLREGASMPSRGGVLDSPVPLLQAWLQNVVILGQAGSSTAQPSVSYYQPWLRAVEDKYLPFGTATALMPGTLRATSFSQDINIVGNLTLSPSPRGTLELAAAGSINGLQINGVNVMNDAPINAWGSTRINLSDANPGAIPGVASPFAYQVLVGTALAANTTQDTQFTFLDNLFKESGSTAGEQGVLQAKQTLHAPGVLHLGDPNPVRLYAGAGDISGVTLFSPKAARIISGREITDIGFYVQNTAASDVTLIATGGDLIACDPNSPLRVRAQSPGNGLNFSEPVALSGDIQISGPGTLEVLAGRNLDLGVGQGSPDGTGVGILSLGNARNPYLPFDGARIIAGAGIGGSTGLAGSNLDFAGFSGKYVTAATVARYFDQLGLPDGVNATNFNQLPVEAQNALALEIFHLVLRDAGRTHAQTGNYDSGFAAIESLFPGNGWKGDISLTSREIKTRSGGSIVVFAPGGKLTVGFDVAGSQPLDQGVLTEYGGGISIFTHGSVVVGTSRIFTLRGGSEIIWSSTGDIAAGASSKTVQSAPPTRVVIDPQSADVGTDLAGLATGGGIGVLATVKGVPPGDVDLIAPSGVIDAGDAGIRVSGNLNIAAVQILNAGNIQVTGASAGTPAAPSVSTAGLGGLAPPPPTTTNTSTADLAQKMASSSQQEQPQEMPSIITVEVIGYGGASIDESAN